MKILLVNPPRSSANEILDYAPSEAKRFIHKKLVGPPLGLLTVASALVEDHDVTIFDMKGEYDLAQSTPPPVELMRQLLEKHQPDVVGVTTIASEFDAAMALLAEAKAWNARVLTVAGGLHAALCPEHFAPYPVDVVIPGEGARTMRELLAAAGQPGGLDQVGGILLREGTALRPSRAPLTPRDPVGADFVMPQRSLLRRWFPTYVVGGNPQPMTYIYTSLGCPSRCSFCSIWPQHQGKFHQRGIPSIIAELKSLDEFDLIRLADANTVVDTDFVSQLFDRIEAEGLRKEFVIDLRMDTAAAHPRLIEKMARLGVKVAITGLESPRNDELTRYNKRLAPAEIEEGLRVCHQNGLLLRANYVIPPDYSLEDLRVLGEFAAAHPAAYAGYTILTPMPGTELYRQEKARITVHDLTKYNFFNCVLATRLEREQFLTEVGRLWLIRTGTHTIS